LRYDDQFWLGVGRGDNLSAVTQQFHGIREVGVIELAD
jgi:hypothetical protein